MAKSEALGELSPEYYAQQRKWQEQQDRISQEKLKRAAEKEQARFDKETVFDKLLEGLAKLHEKIARRNTTRQENGKSR